MPHTITDPMTRLSCLPLTLELDQPDVVFGIDTMRVLDNVAAALRRATPETQAAAWQRITDYEDQVAAGGPRVRDAILVRIYSDEGPSDVFVLGSAIEGRVDGRSGWVNRPPQRCPECAGTDR